MSEELIKASAVIIIVAVFVTLLRNRLGEYSILLLLVAVAVIVISVLGNLFGVIGEMKNLFFKNGSVGVYFITALKALGISYITAFASNICRDFGLSALAQTAEIAGKTAIFTLGFPLVISVLESALKFIGQ